MKAEIRTDEYLHIVPETMAESLAIRFLFPDGGGTDTNIVIHFATDEECKL